MFKYQALYFNFSVFKQIPILFDSKLVALSLSVRSEQDHVPMFIF